MALLIIIFFALAGLHFIYEGILAPSIRLEFRYRLFAMRDRLRSLKADYNDEISNDVFRHLDRSICGLVQALPYLDISFLRRVDREVRNNPELLKDLERRTFMLNACQNGEIQEIRFELVRLTIRAVAANTMFLFFFLLPFLLTTFIIENVYKRCRALFEFIVFAPDKTLKQLEPSVVTNSLDSLV